ncbi:MAG: hypothetical protein ACI9N3_001338, partial [Colwellia sp.]
AALQYIESFLLLFSLFPPCKNKKYFTGRKEGELQEVKHG